jgi:hypothetical protein
MLGETISPMQNFTVAFPDELGSLLRPVGATTCSMKQEFPGPELKAAYELAEIRKWPASLPVALSLF